MRKARQGQGGQGTGRRGPEATLSRRRPTALIVALLVSFALAAPAASQARIASPVTLAGPGSDVRDLGGVAMAADGSGGAVFTEIVDGVPHVFASRFVRGSWSAPMRVDWDQPYEASQPQIAAGPGGALLVVWVTQTATIKGKIRYGLYSASIGRGASSFRPSMLVDPEVGLGTAAGVDPSLSGTGTGVAIVAYRVVTFRFDGSRASAIPQLRPGDVLAEVRVARLREDRWARLGAVNVSQELSTRAPTESNGPQAGAGTDGGAVVAWQESDQSGGARIYLRRVFGTTLGPILQASPGEAGGQPVTGDVDAFSLAVTPLDQARVAMRVLGNGAAAPARLFVNSLPPGYTIPSNVLSGPEEVFSSDPSVPLGAPAVAASEKGSKDGLMRLAFAPARRPRQASVGRGGELLASAPVPGPSSLPAAEVGAVLDQQGGATLAYPTNNAGWPAINVRQELASGAAQSSLLVGPQTGPVSGLAVAGSGTGDALIGFRQGEAGHFALVVGAVTASPAKFKLSGPKGWVKPRAVKLSWPQPQSNVGGLRYTVVLGGRSARVLRKRRFHPPAGLLGNGRLEAQVVATDGLGQQVASPKLTLKVDGEPPRVRLSGPGRGGWLAVRLRDRGAGVDRKRAWVRFGDGTVAAKGAGFRHRYESPGRYRVLVHARDKAGNGMTRAFEVRVP